MAIDTVIAYVGVCDSVDEAEADYQVEQIERDAAAGAA